MHSHAGQDKFYFVGDELREAEAGHVIWAPADVPHGVLNSGQSRLVLLVGIAPAPRK